MDVTKLIRGVRSREPLWDRKHSYYHDRTVTMALWDDVAFSIGVDSETARTKWKGLRDTFRGELRKLHKTLINGRPRTSTNWEYFDEMMFVKDQIYSNKRHLEEMANHVRHHSGQVHSTTDDSNSCDQHRVNGKLKSEPDETLSSPETEDHEHHENGKEDPVKAESLPQVQENHVKKVEDNEREKRKRLKPANDILHKDDTKKKEKALDDDDFNFLMSLLPQMRCLPTTRNLYIRLKIQELLYNEMVASQMRSSM